MHIMLAILHVFAAVRLVAVAGVRTPSLCPSTLLPQEPRAAPLIAPCTRQALVTLRRLIFAVSFVVVIVDNLTVRHHRHWFGARLGHSPVPFLLPIIGSSICPAPR